MVSRSLPIVFLLLTFPLLAALHGTPERELMPRRLDVAESGQMDGRIASDGMSFFSVWTDARSGGSDILGARLRQNGKVLDTVPLVLANTPANEGEPDVTWGRDRYLAVWISDHERVRGRFVAADGTMSDVIEIGARPVSGVPVQPKVAFNGNVFLVVWLESSQTAPNIRGAIIDRDGRVLVTREIVRPATFGFQLAAMAGTFYLARVEPDGRHVVAIPLDGAMNAGDAILLDTSPEPILGIYVASREDDLLVAWTASSTKKSIHSVRLAPNGEQERAAFDSEPFRLWAVAAEGDGYLLQYGDFSSVRARRPGSDGETPVAIPRDIPATVDSAASNGSRTVALIRTSGSYDVYNGDLWASVVGEDTIAPLVVAPRHQTVPDVATAVDVKLAVWAEVLTAEDRIILAGARVDANGITLDAQPLEIGAFTNYEASRPRVASNGSGWLVVWEYKGNVLGRRIRRDGTFLDDTPLTLGSAILGSPTISGQTAVAWDGTNYVVVFISGTLGRDAFVRPFVARVPPSGNSSPAFPVADGVRNYSPSIAAGPNASLIVWTASGQLRGVLLSPGDAITPVNFPARFGSVGDVAWNRDAFLVAADTPPVSGGIRELRWARVDAFGNVLESFSTINVGQASAPPRVVPFGDRFLLLWLQQNLSGAILDRNGNLIDGPSVIAENIQSFSADGAEVVTSHVVPHPTRPSRVFMQSVEWAPEIVPRRWAVRH